MGRPPSLFIIFGSLLLLEKNIPQKEKSIWWGVEALFWNPVCIRMIFYTVRRIAKYYFAEIHRKKGKQFPLNFGFAPKAPPTDTSKVQESCWDGIFGYQFNKRLSLLLHAMRSPFYWRI